MCPLQCLEWLSQQVLRNKLVQTWALQDLPNWVETYLLAHNNGRVRHAAATLLVALVPNRGFQQVREQVGIRPHAPRNGFERRHSRMRSFAMQNVRSSRSFVNASSDSRELVLNDDDLAILHTIFKHLLCLLERAKIYTGDAARNQLRAHVAQIDGNLSRAAADAFADVQAHGHAKLVSYFNVMSHFLISRREKLLFTPHFSRFWDIFQPRISEPAIAQYNNKQAILYFWYQACVDCPENVQLIVNNSYVAKNIAYIYILRVITTFYGVILLPGMSS